VQCGIIYTVKFQAGISDLTLLMSVEETWQASKRDRFWMGSWQIRGRSQQSFSSAGRSSCKPDLVA